MIRLKLSLIGALISLISCAQKGEIIYFNGTIGKYKAIMTLRMLDESTTVTGFYQYEGKLAWLSLTGNSKGGMEILLDEYPYFHNEAVGTSTTGNFKGVLTEKKSFVGKWSSNDRKTILDFSFTRDCGNKGICFYSGQEKNDTVVYSTETEGEQVGSSASIAFLKSNSGNKAFDFYLDTFIFNRLYYPDMFSQEVQILFPDYRSIPYNYVKENAGNYRSEWNAGCDVVWNGNGVLCINNSFWEYAGGAHGLGYQEFNCFDLKSGKQISTDDIFLKGYEEPLRLKGVEHLNLDPTFIERDSLQLNGNFFVTPEGIEFVYNSYEITCYMCGTPSTFIPWNEINQWIDPKGPMAWVRK